MHKYKKVPFYSNFETFLSFIIVLFQAGSLYHLTQHYQYTGLLSFFTTLLISYIATDFINGLVHMIVDNTTNYTSFWGPYVAAFHTHHIKLTYKQSNVIKIYFYESGHKFWLVLYLFLLCYLQSAFLLNSEIELAMVTIGILSSVAEVSHYLCHKQNHSKIITLFQTSGLFLHMKHHRVHHTSDNVNYAFLNGMSDPLLNIIAKSFFKGYKNRSDKHVKNYFKNFSS